MSAINQGFPQLQAPLVTPDNFITQPWYQFLQAIWTRTGSGTGVDITALVAEINILLTEVAALTSAVALLQGSQLFEDDPTGSAPNVIGPPFGAQSDMAPVAPFLWPGSSQDPQKDWGPSLLGSGVPAFTPSPGYGPSIKSVTLGISPATVSLSACGTLCLTGGTVSSVTLGRNGATLALGLTSGLIPIAYQDIVTITYTVLPTATFIPRPLP